MPKRDIRMSDSEVDQFLRRESRTVVIGSPQTGAPRAGLGRLQYGDGHVGFSLREGDPLVTVLTENDRACCVVEEFPSYYEIMGVMLHGHARRADREHAGEAIFELVVEKVVSFDFAKLLATS